MITRIEAFDYRCLHRAAQDVRPFQVLVGPNASGKSTFLDVVALVRDIVRDGRQDIGTVISLRAPDYADLMWKRASGEFQVAVQALVPENLRVHLPSGATACYYWLKIGEAAGSGELGILEEHLSVGPPKRSDARPRASFPQPPRLPPLLPSYQRQDGPHDTIVQKLHSDGKDYYRCETEKGKLLSFTLGRRRSTLANLPEDDELFPVATWFRRFLSESTQSIALKPDAIRRPSPPAAPRSLVSDGCGLPWLVHALESAEDRKSLDEWIGHVRTALPDLRSIRTVEREEDRHRYLKLLYDDGAEVPSWLVSHGTLRLLALTLLPYLPNMTGTYLIEEPENGIHPGALETVFQSLSSVYDGQVLLSTHSPALLSMAELDQVLCFGKSPDAGVDICSGTEHPKLRNWRHEVSLGTYLAGGVLG